MIQLVPQLKILLAYQPVDFRKGIDGLAAVCRQQLDQDPFSGCLFLFRNRRGTAIKILCYDGQGFWLCLKRFSKGRLRWWPKQPSGRLTQLAAQQLHVLLYNGNPDSAEMAEEWRRLPHWSDTTAPALSNSSK
jgi:transposase